MDLAHLPSTYRFSTDDYPEAERLEAWQELFARKIAGSDMTPHPETAFFATAALRSLPGLGLLLAEHTSTHTARTRTHLSDGNDAIIIAMPHGSALGSHLDQEVRLESGDALVLSGAEPSAITMSTRTEIVGVTLSPAVLLPLLRRRSGPPFGRIPGGNEPLRLLRRYLASLWDEPLDAPELQKTVSRQVYDLVALALGANGDAAESAQAGGLAAARLNEAKAYALAHLRRPGLSLDEIARRQGVTPRYLRMIFEREGEIFSQFVRDRRLELAHRMLSSGPSADRSISAIAYDAGFGDLSHFNHAFRARYGATPSDIRAQREPVLAAP